MIATKTPRYQRRRRKGIRRKAEKPMLDIILSEAKNPGIFGEQIRRCFDALRMTTSRVFRQPARHHKFCPSSDGQERGYR